MKVLFFGSTGNVYFLALRTKVSGSRATYLPGVSLILPSFTSVVAFVSPALLPSFNHRYKVNQPGIRRRKKITDHRSFFTITCSVLFVFGDKGSCTSFLVFGWLFRAPAVSIIPEAVPNASVKGFPCFCWCSPLSTPKHTR